MPRAQQGSLITLIADYEILLRTHSDGYIKGNKYFFFIKVGTADVISKLNYFMAASRI